MSSVSPDPQFYFADKSIYTWDSFANHSYRPVIAGQILVSQKGNVSLLDVSLGVSPLSSPLQGG